MSGLSIIVGNSKRLFTERKIKKKKHRDSTGSFSDGSKLKTHFTFPRASSTAETVLYVVAVVSTRTTAEHVAHWNGKECRLYIKTITRIYFNIYRLTRLGGGWEGCDRGVSDRAIRCVSFGSTTRACVARSHRQWRHTLFVVPFLCVRIVCPPNNGGPRRSRGDVSIIFTRAREPTRVYT